MTACSLLCLLILRQPFKLIFLFSGQLATNSLGLVAKGFLQAPKYIHFFYFCKPKNVNKNKYSVGDCIEYFLLYYR